MERDTSNQTGEKRSVTRTVTPPAVIPGAGAGGGTTSVTVPTASTTESSEIYNNLGSRAL